jgi:hypothetical protein
MKVKIKDLEPNPYRDINNYPMDKVKLNELKRSIKRNGFWDNILGRPKPGDSIKIQIAYGHHRLHILKEVFKPEQEVDIPIKDLSDAQMIQIMADENNNDYSSSVAVDLETIKVTRQFLKDHPEEVKTPKPLKANSLQASTRAGYYHSPEAFQIHEFLDWSEHRVSDAITQLDAILAGDIEKEVIVNMPSKRAADRFTSTVIKRKKENKKVSIPEQRKIAKDLHKAETFSKKDIDKAFDDLEVKSAAKKAAIEKERLKKFEDEITKTSNCVDELLLQLIILLKFKDDFNSEYYIETYARKRLIQGFDKLGKQIILLTKKSEENEKQRSIGAKSI